MPGFAHGEGSPQDGRRAARNRDDGRVFTGRQGVGLKLVDELGNEKTAIAWLAKEKGLKADTPVKDWDLKPRFSDLSILHLGVAIALEAVGAGSLAQRVEAWGALHAVERLNLDGLLALWHLWCPEPEVRIIKRRPPFASFGIGNTGG